MDWVNWVNWVTGFKILNAQTLKLMPNKHMSTGFHVQLTPDNVQLAPNKKHRDSKNDWRDSSEIEMNNLEFSQLLTNLKILPEI